MCRQSISLSPITNTTAASTAFGMYCSGLVRKSRTIATIAAIASIEIWLDAFASSAILLFVGLPLTTKVLLRPAAMLAALRPTMSVFSSKCSLYLTA